MKEEQQQLSKYGVLIPPSFGVGHETMLAPSTLGRLGVIPMTYIENLRQRLFQDRILADHTTPGLWISAATASRQGAVFASCVLGETSKTSESKQGSLNGMLSASSTLPFGTFQVRALNSASPLMALATLNPLPGLRLEGDVAPIGGSFGLACHWDVTQWTQHLQSQPESNSYYRNDPFPEAQHNLQSGTTGKKFQLGSWIRGKTSSTPNLSVDGVNAYASLELPAGIAAVEGFVPTGSSSPRDAQFSYLISVDLNSDGESASSGPPLMVTLEQTPDNVSMNLSQVVSFDRKVVNVLEERCPRIRNTLGWTVQMNKPLVVSKSSDDASSSSEPTLAAGLAWQVNRNVCLKIKAAASDQDGTNLTAGVVLKRWKQPRITCSLLLGARSFPAWVGFQGIGFELESGPMMNGKDIYSAADDERTHVTTEDVPATKATLPTRRYGSL